MSEQQEYDPTEPPPTFCEGVKLLLQRMESHPDEFNLDHGKWARELTVIYARISGKTPPHRAEPWLTTAEANAVWEKYIEIKRNEFHNHVMKKLLDDKEDHGLDAYTLSQGKQFNPYQNDLQPGAIVPIATTSTTTSSSLVARLKQELGIK